LDLLQFALWGQSYQLDLSRLLHLLRQLSLWDQLLLALLDLLHQLHQLHLLHLLYPFRQLSLWVPLDQYNIHQLGPSRQLHLLQFDRLDQLPLLHLYHQLGQ
jgi:hypothetical protein